MPLNQTSILTSAQGRQLAQRRWQAAASVPATPSLPAEITTDIAIMPNPSLVRAAALAGIAGLVAFIFCEWIRRQLLRSAETQSSHSPQIGNDRGGSVLIALAIVIGVFVVQL